MFVVCFVVVVFVFICCLFFVVVVVVCVLVLLTVAALTVVDIASYGCFILSLSSHVESVVYVPVAYKKQQVLDISVRVCVVCVHACSIHTLTEP